MGFLWGNVLLCPYLKKSEKGVVYVALYVNDDLMVGHPEAISESIAALKQSELVLKVVERWKDYSSCEVRFLLDKTRVQLGQTHLYQKHEEIQQLS